jgi:hypothetical protein
MQAESESGRRKTLLLGGAAVLALLAWALWPRSEDRSSAAASTSGSAPASATTTDPSGALGASRPFASGAASTPIAPASPDFVLKVLTDYKAAAAYPPWSRIHDEGTRYKLEWNKPVVDDLSFSDKPGAETTYHFASDRAHVMFGEALTSWIEVWEKGDPNKRLAANVVNAWVMMQGGAKPGRTVQLAYKDDGTDGDAIAGDHRYTNRMIPSSLAELKDPTQVRIQAEVEVDGVHKLLVRDFTYAPRDVLSIVSFSDGVADGSLVVNLEVDAHEPGLFTFEANVFDDQGKTAIAYAEWSQSLVLGKSVVPLKFFGKAFHDVGVDGPYLVKDFRGFLRPTGAAVEQANVWWSDAHTYTTKAWKRGDFSSADWDDPEKRDKIRQLEAIASASAAPSPSASQPKAIHIDEHGVAHVVE